MLGYRNGRRGGAVVAGLGAIAAMVFVIEMAEAHDISPGAPDWCKEHNSEVDARPESDSQRPSTDFRPGDWPGPVNHLGMKRTELGAISLGTEFPGFIGRNLRARYWVMEPGGVIAHHCHDDRPTLVYLLTGKVKETKWVDGKPQIMEYKAGDSIPEGSGTRHWWVNPKEFDESVTMVAVDLANIDHTRPPASGAASGKRTVGAWFNLADEFPHIGGLRGIMAQGSVLILQPGDATSVTHHTRRPRFAYVIEGAVTEHRSDSIQPITRNAECESSDELCESLRSSQASGTTWSYWVNDGSEPTTVYVYEFIDCEGDCRPTGHAPRNQE